ncbi:hypothetical protein FACS1894159_10350 [Bacteroidia bacterium]|nr:hypothetical protein FACS1894159_10350 [Bacteroidia bacterium]
MKKFLTTSLCIVVALAATLGVQGVASKSATSLAAMPPMKADTALIRTHLVAICQTDGFRNYRNIKILDQTAEYIHSVFRRWADTVFYQPFQVQGRTYKNVVCRFASHIDLPVVIVGAHYDVCGDQQGADDNASGVVGLLELARLLGGGVALTRPVELVAFTLEEPPFFRTPNMGSSVHARSLRESGRKVYGMAALEMIGYFDERRFSQNYPVKALKVAYGSRGDYIMLVKRIGYGEFTGRFSAHFASARSTVATHNLKAPAKVEGIDFSDHMNYWKEGYDALMVTNTAFFRNSNYHRPTDTIQTLDIPRMGEVIGSVAWAVVNIDR